MHIVRHLRALSDRSSYSRKTHVVKGGHNPRTGEIWEPRKRKRSVNRRVKRWRNRNGYGYMIVNDGPSLALDIGRIIMHFGAAVVIDERSGLLDDLPGETASGAWWRSFAAGSGGDDLPGDWVGGDYFDGPPTVEADPFGGGDAFDALVQLWDG